MKTFQQIPVWLVIAALLTALTIIGHEIAHYLGALAMGASDVALHWADVTFDAATLSGWGLAFTWFAGPLFTHAIILVVLLSRASGIVALALGLGACSRDLVVLPFTIKLLLGRDVSTFTNDEVTAAAALGIAPHAFAVFAAGLGLVGLAVFLNRAYRSKGALFAVTLILGTLAGIALWSVIGPTLLPGGKGVG